VTQSEVRRAQDHPSGEHSEPSRPNGATRAIVSLTWPREGPTEESLADEELC